MSDQEKDCGPTQSENRKVQTVREVTTAEQTTPSSEFYCTATDCEKDAVMAVLIDGVFDGFAYCRRPGHRAEVLADATSQGCP